MGAIRLRGGGVMRRTESLGVNQLCSWRCSFCPKLPIKEQVLASSSRGGFLKASETSFSCSSQDSITTKIETFFSLCPAFALLLRCIFALLDKTGTFAVSIKTRPSRRNAPPFKKFSIGGFGDSERATASELPKPAGKAKLYVRHTHPPR